MINVKIKNLRQKFELTQEQLANKLDIAPSTIGMYEQGRRTPNLDTFIKMSNIFQTSIDVLLGLEEKFYIKKSIQIEELILDLIDFIRNQDCIFFKGKKLTSQEIEKIVCLLKFIISRIV